MWLLEPGQLVERFIITLMFRNFHDQRFFSFLNFFPIMRFLLSRSYSCCVRWCRWGMVLYFKLMVGNILYNNSCTMECYFSQLAANAAQQKRIQISQWTVGIHLPVLKESTWPRKLMGKLESQHLASPHYKEFSLPMGFPRNPNQSKAKV